MIAELKMIKNSVRTKMYELQIHITELFIFVENF